MTQSAGLAKLSPGWIFNLCNFVFLSFADSVYYSSSSLVCIILLWSLFQKQVLSQVCNLFLKLSLLKRNEDLLCCRLYLVLSFSLQMFVQSPGGCIAALSVFLSGDLLFSPHVSVFSAPLRSCDFAVKLLFVNSCHHLVCVDSCTCPL